MSAAYDKKKQCPVCRKEFWAARRAAVYCSDTCRQRGHRKPSAEKRMGEFYDNARMNIMSLVAVTGRGVEAYRAQRRLQSLVVETIQHLDDQTRRMIYDQIKDDLYRLYRDS